MAGAAPRAERYLPSCFLVIQGRDRPSSVILLVGDALEELLFLDHVREVRDTTPTQENSRSKTYIQ